MACLIRGEQGRRLAEPWVVPEGGCTGLMISGRCGVVSGGLGSMRCCGGTMVLFSGFRSTCGGGTISGRGSLILFLPPGLGESAGRWEPGIGPRFAPGMDAGGRSDTSGLFSGVIGGVFGLRGVSLRFGVAFGGCSAGCAMRTSSRGILGAAGRSNRGLDGSCSGTLTLLFSRSRIAVTSAGEPALFQPWLISALPIL